MIIFKKSSNKSIGIGYRYFLLIKLSAIPFAILFIKSMGDTLGNTKKVWLILSHQYQYCDINNTARHQIPVDGRGQTGLSNCLGEFTFN